MHMPSGKMIVMAAVTALAVLAADPSFVRKDTVYITSGGLTVTQGTAAASSIANIAVAANDFQDMKIVNALSLGVDDTGVVDCAPLINNCIADYASHAAVYNDDGIVLFFPKGVYRIHSPIKLGNNPTGKGFKVKIIGAGADQTVFQTGKGNNIFEIDLTPPYNASVRGATIRDCSIVSNAGHNYTTQIGIYIYNTAYASSKHPAELRGGIIENVNIYHCAYGIKIGPKVGILCLNNILIDDSNQFGFYNESTDSIFSNFRITSCRNGLYSEGGNNLWSNFKIYQNGICSHGEDYKTTYGAKFYCPRNVFTNMDFQENYYHGAVFYNCNNIILNGVILDGNGYGKTAISGTSYGGNGLVLDGCYNVNGTITADNLHTSSPTQYYGLEIKSNCYNININYTENNQVNSYPGTNALNTVVHLPGR